MKDRRNLAQNFISQQVAKFVVQVLELIDVHHDYRHACTETAGPLDFFGDAHFKVAAVENAGQSVEIGQLFYPLHITRILNRGRANVGGRFQWLGIVVLEGSLLDC